jgi:hypothetical protein
VDNLVYHLLLHQIVAMIIPVGAQHPKIVILQKIHFRLG